ncbi:MAG: hypothetical protein J6I76_21670 [Oribacterium sp.]|nr:hypothetical protein [Oribacterium sp.]
MMIKRYGDWIRFFSFVLIFSILLSRVSLLFEKKDSIAKREKFYQIEQDIDVLFLGSSVMVTGVFPMELWNEYGIASYNYAGHAEQMAGNYWNLVNALNYTNPKLVVIDIFNMPADFKVYEEELSYYHMSIDAMPMSLTKVRAVNDLTPKGQSRLEYLFDFALYHSRWNELSMSDVHVKYNKAYGSERRVSSIYADSTAVLPDNEYTEYESIGVEYLRKMIVLCQEKGIDCLLVQIPYAATEDNQRKRNYAYKIAEDYRIRFLNMMQDESGNPIIDNATDLCDGTYHLNPSGAVKTTHYLGKYLKETYDLPDRREDNDYDSWQYDYLEYRNNVKFEELKNSYADIYTFLLLLYDRDIQYEMRIKGTEEAMFDGDLTNLFQNLGVDVNTLTSFKSDGSEAVYNIYSNMLEVSYLDSDFEDMDRDNDYVLEIICYDASNGRKICHVGYWYTDGRFIGEEILESLTESN